MKTPEVETFDIEPPTREKPKEQTVFFRSTDPHVRLLSSLIIIKTVNQGEEYEISRSHIYLWIIVVNY